MFVVTANMKRFISIRIAHECEWGVTYLIEHLSKRLMIGHHNGCVVVLDGLVHDTASLAHAQTIRGLAAVLVALRNALKMSRNILKNMGIELLPLTMGMPQTLSLISVATSPPASLP